MYLALRELRRHLWIPGCDPVKRDSEQLGKRRQESLLQLLKDRKIVIRASLPLFTFERSCISMRLSPTGR